MSEETARRGNEFEPRELPADAIQRIRQRALADQARRLHGWNNSCDADRRELLGHVAALELQVKQMQRLYNQLCERFDEAADPPGVPTEQQRVSH